MKKIILNLVFLVLLTALLKAQIPNNGFETWEPYPDPDNVTNIYEKPDQWIGQLPRSPQDYAYSIVKNSESYPAGTGKYSMLITNNLLLGVNGMVLSYDKRPSVDLKDTWPYIPPAFPVNYRPKSLCLYYKYLPVGGDSMRVACYFYKNGKNIGEAVYVSPQNIQSWTALTIPVTFSTQDIPDSAAIVLCVFAGNYQHEGSKLYVDNISFDYLFSGSIYCDYLDPVNITITTNESIDVFGRIFISDLTIQAGHSSLISVSLLLSNADSSGFKSDPRFEEYNVAVFTAIFNTQVENKYEYKASVKDLPIGKYNFCYKYVYNDTTYLGGAIGDPGWFHPGKIIVTGPSSMQFRIDSIGTMSGNNGYYISSLNNGVVYETDFMFSENGYLRWYAFMMSWQSSFTYLPDSTYSTKLTLMNIGDSWTSWIGQPTKAVVADSETVTVPAGTFFTYVVKHYLKLFPDSITAIIYVADNIGDVKMKVRGGIGELASYSIVGGSGYYPLAVGNSWSFNSVLTDVNIDQANSLTLYKYNLHQNYPNPFNPTTTIEYQIPKQSFVTLKLFDLLGREVATLVNEQKDAGSHSARWDASAFSSGIYFYQLTTGEKTIVKKMVLMK